MRVSRDAATDPMSGTTETKQLEESPINDGNPVDAVLNNSNESSDDINETYAGRDLTGSDGDVEECDEELPGSGG